MVREADAHQQLVVDLDGHSHQLPSSPGHPEELQLAVSCLPGEGIIEDKKRNKKDNKKYGEEWEGKERRRMKRMICT